MMGFDAGAQVARVDLQIEETSLFSEESQEMDKVSRDR